MNSNLKPLFGGNKTKNDNNEIITYIYYKLKPTWGIIVSFDLRLWSPISEMVTPSTVMLPPAASIMRNRERVSDDFPAPVLPTMPICIIYYKEKLKLNRQKST